MKETGAMRAANHAARMAKVNATIGIDLDEATPQQVAKRAQEFCREMADCYEADTLEHGAFMAVAAAIEKIKA
jgi:hypothetical protein